MKKRLFLELSLGLLFIVSIASFIYAGGLLPNNRNQEKVKIIVYQQGKDVTLDSKSRYFLELLESLEDVLRHAETFPMKRVITKEDLKEDNNCSFIEVIYPKAKEIKGVKKSESGGLNGEVLCFILPLTGKFALGDNYRGIKRILLIYQEDKQVTPSGPFGTTKEVQKINEILKKFNM